MTRIEHDIKLTIKFKLNIEQRLQNQVESHFVSMPASVGYPVLKYQTLYNKRPPVWVIYAQIGEYEIRRINELSQQIHPTLCAWAMNKIHEHGVVLVCIALKGIGNKCNSGFLMSWNELLYGIEVNEAQSRVQSDFGVADQLIDALNGVDSSIKALVKSAALDPLS
ncbi:hypothetical protein [Pseudoalteromonas luteoviolacea]|uniref:hypothetical protein n=1 Tax=Pseudoalteromonas luteoviolacea TaxID=43657 RepID=UPI0007B048D7|nr:hypothetical protein [Pseudoalteromonas luteoviolacea]KZN55051.1 hypothetical protein N474_16400 [Pseudoalteromonas luteoviolacea CPMOR-2]TQF68035.1 hypothetical protein FLM44_22975 [Pseudoalteromonas luteoviolacea]